MHLTPVNSRALRIAIVNNESHTFFSGRGAKLFGHFLYDHPQRRCVRIEPHGTAKALNELRLPGVRFDAVVFTPTADVYKNVPCSGIRLVVTDREAIRPVTVGLDE